MPNSIFRPVLLLTALFLAAVVPSDVEAARTSPESPKASVVPATGEGPSPQVTLLENGLTVLTMEDDRFPLASVRLYVRAGAAYESAGNAGISHLLEHMVFKGTAKRDPGAVAAEIEGVGGNINAATSFDYTVYYVDVPAEQWALGLDIIKDMTYGARIDPAELEQEKKVVISELERGEDNPGQLLFKTQQEMVWGGTAYGLPVIGTRESLESITRDDILEYIRRMYQPRSMVLVVVGDVDSEEVLKEARRLYGSVENTTLIAPAGEIDLPTPGRGPQVRVRRGNWNRAYVSAAFPVPGLASAQAVGLDVLSQMLGGDRTSLLYRRFKYDLRMVDSISASALTLSRGGVLYISATLDADRVQDFWRELVATLASVSADSFDAQELARAKLNLEDGLFQAKETLGGLASKLGYFQFFEHSQEAEENYLYLIRSVDDAQIQGLLNAYLVPDRLSSAMLLPETEAVGLDGDELAGMVGNVWKTPPTERESVASAVHGGPEVIDVEGNTVVLLPDTTLPYAGFSMSWAGGDGLLQPDEQGLCELASRVLTKGAGAMSALEIQTYLADRASDLGASGNRESFTLTAKFPSRFEQDMLGLVRTILTRPDFRSDEVDRAAEEQLASIARTEDQPVSLAFRNIFPFLFNSQGYRYLHLGTRETVDSFTPDDVRSFWKRQTGQTFTLALCGTFHRDAVLELARTLADELKSGRGEDYRYLRAEWNEDSQLNLTLPGRNQSHLMRIFPVPGRDHPDSAGLDLLRAALSGQSGILFRDLRDKQGLGYSVTAFLWQAPRTGFMVFYIGTDPERKDEALAGFDAAIAALRSEPLPEEEVSRAKNLLSGEYYRDHQSLLSRSREAAGLMAKGFALDYNRELIEAARKLTPEDITALARTYLEPGESYLVTVTP